MGTSHKGAKQLQNNAVAPKGGEADSRSHAVVTVQIKDKNGPTSSALIKLHQRAKLYHLCYIWQREEELCRTII